MSRTEISVLLLQAICVLLWMWIHKPQQTDHVIIEMEEVRQPVSLIKDPPNSHKHRASVQHGNNRRGTGISNRGGSSREGATKRSRMDVVEKEISVMKDSMTAFMSQIIHGFHEG